MNKIIIIEDDIAICNMIKKFLENNKYSVQYALNGIEGIHLCKSFVPDLIILDIMLPGLNGDDVLQKLRKFTNAPVIVVSAKTMVQTKIELLKMGADDYMTKPFAIEELLARIRVALNRQKSSVEDKKESSIMEYGDLQVDTAKYEASYQGNKLAFTKKEFDLVAYLLAHKNEAISRERILSEVWDYEYMGETNVVDVYVRYVRQKLDDVYGKKIINTVRGVGYIIKDE